MSFSIIYLKDRNEKKERKEMMRAKNSIKSTPSLPLTKTNLFLFRLNQKSKISIKQKIHVSRLV
jgi:hypothetical protein